MSVYDTRNVPKAGTEYKVFLVEVDDEDRERVLQGRVRAVEITNDPVYDSIHVDDMLSSAKVFKTEDDVTMTLKMVPSENGTYFTMVNFMEDEEEE